jgi:predicted dehydrogenase
MTRVGIVGLGFMGKMHLRCYRELEDLIVAAICDADQERLTRTTGAAGNIEGAQAPPDLTGVELYSDFDKMLKEAKLDAISITLPTYMHKDFTIKALEAGVNVLCEKPMALNLDHCRQMIQAAEKTGKILQIGHCIRFWPEYAKAKQLIDSGDYGQPLVASFTRLTSAPTWSWNNWLMNSARSGGALLDLHIHDADFIQYLFGMPKAVRSHATKGPSGDFDYVATQYLYNDEKIVAAEGGFVMTPSFGFKMGFDIVLEKAAILFDSTRSPSFILRPAHRQPFTPKVEPGDGYSLEIAHFLKTVTGQNVPQMITPAQSLDSIKLVLAEKQSAKTKKEVKIK